MASNRLDGLRKQIEISGVDCAILSSGDNLFYFLGLEIVERAGYAIMAKDGSITVLVPPMHFEMVRGYFNAGEIRVGKTGVPLDKFLQEILRGRSKIGFDDIPLGTYLSLANSQWHPTLVDISDRIWNLRMKKDASEIQKLERAGSITVSAMRTVPNLLRGGDLTELKLKAELIYTMMKAGADGLAYDPIIASGPNSVYPHGGRDRKITSGDVVTVDIGAKFEGYCSDMTRTFYLGANPPARYNAVYKAVEAAKEKADAQIVPGAVCSEIEQTARRAIDDAGFGRFAYPHSGGHGVGLVVHEPPKISPTSGQTIQEEMAIAFEPGIYIPGEFGIRLEDTFHVTSNETRNLTELETQGIVRL